MKINNIYKLLLVLVFFTSCNKDDIFEADPDSVVIDNFFQDEDEFTLAIRGAYNRLKAVGYYGGSGASGDIIIVGDLLSDNLVTNPDGRGSNFRSHNWQYNDNTIPTAIYTQAYVVIARANIVLDKIDNLDNGPVKDRIRAEALALRAAMHFDVARFFSKIPTQSSDANSSLGIAYLETFDPLAVPARLATVSETYEKINADLDLALSLIGTDRATETGRFDIFSLQALITRVALHEGNYARVIEFGLPVINGEAPAMASELASLWISASSPGVLFEVPFIVSNNLLDSNFSQGLGTSLIAEYSVDKAFYDLYDQATEPERINAYFTTANNWIVVNKYINGALQTGLNNGRYLRVEEVILNVAEAYYFSNESLALSTLNKLRDVRYSSYTGGESGDALFDAIMLERRKELAFETSDRWFTLKRLQNVANIPTSYKQGVVRSGNGYFADGTGTPPAELILPAGNFKWQLPIQQAYRDLNPNLIQNDGY